MIIISGAELLSYQRENRFLGDSFRIASNKNLTVKGILYSQNTFSGVSGILNQINDIDSLPDYEEIYLNGENFGRGRINRISHPEGPWVRLARPEISITIYDTGDSYTILGSDLAGLYDVFVNSGYLINSLDESINSSTREDDTRSYSHSVNLKLNGYSGSGVLSEYNCCDLANTISEYLFNNNSFFNNTYLSGYFQSGLKSNKRKVVDIVNYNFSYQRDYNVASNIISGTTLSYSHSLTLDQNGIVSVTENGEIVGILSDYYSNARNRFALEVPDNSLVRCDEIRSYYCPNFSGLMSGYKNLSSTHNKRAGTINYNITFDNDLKNSGNYVWNSVIEIDYNDILGVTNVVENGSFKGRSRNFINRYPYALSGFSGNALKPMAYARISGVYAAEVAPNIPLSILSSSRTLNSGDSLVSYSYEYTDDISRRNLTGFIKRIVVRNGNKDATDLVGVFKVNDNGFELEQYGGYIPAEASKQVEMELGRMNSSHLSAGYNLYSLISSYINYGGLYESVSFDFSYPSQTAKLNANRKQYG